MVPNDTKLCHVQTKCKANSSKIRKTLPKQEYRMPCQVKNKESGRLRNLAAKRHCTFAIVLYILLLSYLVFTQSIHDLLFTFIHGLQSRKRQWLKNANLYPHHILLVDIARVFIQTSLQMRKGCSKMPIQYKDQLNQMIKSLRKVITDKRKRSFDLTFVISTDISHLSR